MNQKEFRKIIKAYLDSQGMTAKELAEKTGANILGHLHLARKLSMEEVINVFVAIYKDLDQSQRESYLDAADLGKFYLASVFTHRLSQAYAHERLTLLALDN